MNNSSTPGAEIDVSQNCKWLVRYMFLPGHTYQLSGFSLIDNTLTITDVDTKETKTFDNDDDVDRQT